MAYDEKRGNGSPGGVDFFAKWLSDLMAPDSRQRSLTLRLTQYVCLLYGFVFPLVLWALSASGRVSVAPWVAAPILASALSATAGFWLLQTAPGSVQKVLANKQMGEIAQIRAELVNALGREPTAEEFRAKIRTQMLVVAFVISVIILGLYGYVAWLVFNQK